MKQRILIAALALTLGVGCSNIWLQHPASWTPAMLSGLTLSQGDSTFSFSPDGSGHYSPNPRAFLGYDPTSWRIEAGWLILTDPQGRNRGQFRLESVGLLSLTVSTREGKTLKFGHYKR